VILADCNQPYEKFDEINASLISNTVNQKNFHKFLKSVIKKCRKAVLTNTPYKVPRSCSWLNRTLNNVRNHVNARLKQLTLLQTRASGYPNEDIRITSIKQWMEVVSKSPVENLDLSIEMAELERYVRDKFRINAFTVRETHVSLGVSACLESSRKKGGKSAFARELICSEKSCNMIDLQTGEITCNFILAEKEPGEFLFHSALRQYVIGNPNLLSVKVGGIDEVGEKHRIITVPSFYHSTILSPWSHLTYQWLKTCRETKNGVAGTNHAWELSLSLTSSDPDLGWVFSGGNTEVFNSDLEQATDHIYHSAIEQILEIIQAVMPVQDWYFSVVKQLLSSNRPFSVIMENLIISGVTSCGVFMGDHGSKTVLTASGITALSGMKFPRHSRLVGDDQCTVCEDGSTAEVVYRTRMEKMGYKLSEDDTFVSKTGFYAEEGFEIPKSPSHSTEIWTFKKVRSELPFLDVPKAKILTDPGKDLGMFSDTAMGKITLLGVRMEQTGRTYREALFHLASWIQDICISLIYRKEFVYFPRFLVQTGKPILFGCSENTVAFLRMHRQGRLQGHYADIMDQALNPTSHGHRIIQSFFTHGANNQQIRILKREFPVHEFEEDLLLTHEKLKGFAPFILTRLGPKVISESEIVAKLSEMENLLSIPVPTKRLTVANLARGQLELTDELLAKFIESWQTNSKLLRLRKEEKYYDREAVEAKLQFSHPLRVKGLLKPLRHEEKKLQIATERDREITILYNWVKTNPFRLDDIPRALIRDDLLLLSDYHLTCPQLLVVTKDYSLVNNYAVLRNYNWRHTRTTYHITVMDWLRAGMTAEPHFSNEEVFVDEGAWDGLVDKHFNCPVTGVSLLDRMFEVDSIKGLYRLVRPNSTHRLPQEVMEVLHLRAELPTIAEDS